VSADAIATAANSNITAPNLIFLTITDILDFGDWVRENIADLQ
jgi:hypothetical protein